ncbi:NADH:flavin oxidoreductase/NADH oxidase family protein [Mycobacterium spongiae]|uniref:NADH oxidase n=1 Tax=Mycobacterium spongiae TaxID=886343 RepID=A0A975JVE7_9MYCO|nr:NADH:flavin oxidoreductase/NADH oxidase family protein [Mycobacterium spongiae]QUR66093.1 NADH oxidase [Mycobacterium spongiae]
MSSLQKPLALRSGSVLPNRISKAAMSEVLATPDGRVTPAHLQLYDTWGASQAGLLITGNVMVDGRHINEPLVVDGLHPDNFTALKKWALLGPKHGVHIWPQLSHPGKQSPKIVNDVPLAPSAVPIDNPMFQPPRELTEDEIWDIVDRFAQAAHRCEKAGFSGVQLHGAHGYLLSQFFSPHHNRRTDKWGGSFDNRMRFVSEVYQEIRNRTGADFNVAIKINSSDFQKGGFTQEDSLRVAQALDAMGIDLIEISGGSWENPVNRRGTKESTRRREAYFLDYAEKVKSLIDVPLMVTGGFRTKAAMESAIDSGAVDIIGLARAFAVDPYVARNVFNDNEYTSSVQPITTGIKKVDQMAVMEISWYTMQIHHISQGKAPHQKAHGAFSLPQVLFNFWKNGRAVKRVRA